MRTKKNPPMKPSEPVELDLYTQVMIAISSETDKQKLVNLNRAVVDRLNFLQRKQSIIAMDTLKVGDEVFFDARGERYYGVIEAFKRTKVHILTTRPYEQRWACSAANLTKV